MPAHIPPHRSSPDITVSAFTFLRNDQKLGYPFGTIIQSILLLVDEVAGLALGNFLGGGVAGHFAQGLGGIDEVTAGQAGADLGVFNAGGEDEVAIVGDDGNGTADSMGHMNYVLSGFGG